MRVGQSTVFHIALFISLFACGEDPGAHSHRIGRQGGGAESTFKVALLTPGPVTDQAWNAAAYRGLLRIKDSLGAQVSHVETKTPADFEENFRQYGAQGYNLLFANGFEYQDVIQRVAPDYPQSIFITTSGDRTGANWAGIDFRFEDGAYLAGIVAGMMTRTNVIATIGGTDLPPVRRGFAGFAAGARSVNPGVKILSAYIGNWEDASAAKEQTLAQIGRGADVIFQNADAAGLGAFQAVKDSKGVWILGSNSDQNGVAPTVTLGSVVIDLPHALLMVAQQVRAGLFIPRVITLGAQQQVVKLVLNPTLGPDIPAQVREAVDSVQRSLALGRLVLHIDPEATADASIRGATAADPATAESAAQPVGSGRATALPAKGSTVASPAGQSGDSGGRSPARAPGTRAPSDSGVH